MGVKREIGRLLCAVQLLTRWPTPRLAELEPDWMARSAKYFPLVGQAVGLVCAGVWLAAGWIWGAPLAALLAIATGAALTGAFHEDGLADTADGLWGGRSRAQRLSIMKDSRIGAFGVLALGFCIALRVVALAGLPAGPGAWAMVGAHGGGRLAATAMMRFQPYAGDPAVAKVEHGSGRVRAGELAFAALICAWPLGFLRVAPAVAGVVMGALAVTWLALAAKRRIGGYTGDVLGAAEQLFETAFLLGAATVFQHGG